MQTEQMEQQVERQQAAIEPYVTPAIEIINIELQQNILGGSGPEIPDIPGEGA